MKRLRRWTVNFIALVSTLLLIATCGLWARSYTTAQFAGWFGPVPWFGVLSMSGEIRIERCTYAFFNRGWVHESYANTTTSRTGLAGEIATLDPGNGLPRRMGFAFARSAIRPGATRTALYLPHWFLVTLFAIIPAWRVWAATHGRSCAGYCPVCGYDLRATPDKCPECGTSPKPVPNRAGI
jgi:4-amino-4-deoxy-L-arabinose transferase-like glycosyltransferase